MINIRIKTQKKTCSSKNDLKKQTLKVMYIIDQLIDEDSNNNKQFYIYIYMSLLIFLT